MSMPAFYIRGVQVTGWDPEGDPAIVSFVQGHISGLALTELATLTDHPVEIHWDNEPGDLIWIFVLEGLLTGKLNGKGKIIIPAKMIHLDTASASGLSYEMRGRDLVHLLFIQLKAQDLDSWLVRSAMQYLHKIIRSGVIVGASTMPMGLSHYIAVNKVVKEWCESSGLTGDNSHLLDWLLSEAIYYVAYQQSHQQSAHSSNGEDRVLRVVQDWLSSVDQPMDVEILCRLTGLNATRLQEVFKSEFEEPAMQFIRRVRLEKARPMVEETAQSLSSIAHATGFSNLTHFSQAFKRQFGVSPRAYRASHAK